MFKYMEIVEWVHKEIEAGTLKANNKLPTEKELSARFGVSRQSVRRAIRELEGEGLVRTIQGSGNYVSNTPAVSSNKIALVLANYEGHIFPQTVRGITHTLEEAGYINHLFVLDNLLSRENQIMHTIMREHYAGLLLDGAQSALPRADEAYFRHVTETIPTVMMDAIYPGYKLPAIAIDDEMGGYIATKHLIDHGHRHIAYIGRVDYAQNTLRYKGYIRALLEHDLPFDDSNVFLFMFNHRSLIFDGSMGDHLFSILSRNSAVFCFCDELARDIIDFLSRRGMRIPDDISVMGYDNMPLPGYPYQLSSIEHPKERLGKMAARNLIRLIHDPSFDANYRFAPVLVPGKTVRRLDDDR